MSLLSPNSATILGIGRVLPQSEPTPLELPADLGGQCLAFQCDPSPGKGILPASALRRCGRAQRMAMTATHLALEDASLQLDARENVSICIGTAWGELGNTYAFLENMITRDELQPKPAAFVNSVHNSIASQAAISLKCKGENHTTIHSSISFENALWQAIHILNRNRAEHVVVCGVDELSGYIVEAEQACGRLPVGIATSADADTSPMTLPGEGAVAFVLGRAESSEGHVQIRSIRSRPWSPARLTAESRDAEIQFIQKSLDCAQIDVRDIDFVVCNDNGTPDQSDAYRDVVQVLSRASGREIPFGGFQQAIGNFRTASAAGIMLAAETTQAKELPNAIRCFSDIPANPIRTVLSYSLYPTGFQSACLLSQ